MAERRRIPLTELPADPHVCSPAVRLERLAQTSLFANLTAEEVAAVDRHCRVFGFDADEAIYSEGQPATRIYVVATGVAKSTRTSADGRETILDLHVPGDFFGALPALGDALYTDWAWSVIPSCLLGIDAAAYDEIMEEIPAVAMATLKGVSRRLSDAQRSVHLLAGMPLEQRLAAILLLLKDRAGRKWENGTLLDVPLTRDDLASMTGAATESISRLLSKWRRDGLIDSGRRWVSILDSGALTAIKEDFAAD